MRSERAWPRPRYERLCEKLERTAGRLRLAPVSGRGLAHGRGEPVDPRLDSLARTLEIAEIHLHPSAVVAAANAAAGISMILFALALAAVALLNGGAILAPVAFCLASVPLIVRQAVLEYPASVARKRAAETLKGSPSAANLMIMSLRHEPSLSKALQFASAGDGGFARELRGCLWAVLMGRKASFEESLQALGAKWEEYSPELKTSLNSMVTASCEATEAGRRRALDRANHAMIAGAKRRIEEYVLSLSAPAMLMFGLGILLPLMVGSFMPMLSWNLWPATTEVQGASGGSSGLDARTVFVMNILFPSIAALVAIGAVSRHPLERGRYAEEHVFAAYKWLVPALAATVLLSALAWFLLDGTEMAAGLLMATVCPTAIWLFASGMALRGHVGPGTEAKSEDVLFRVGARLQEGENLECALARVASELRGPTGSPVRSLLLRSSIPGYDPDSALEEECGLRGARNALEAFRVVRRAATKDEQSAGVLAMDLASYLTDLAELESGLKNKLRPTISMMRITAYALAPIVLGITFSIYLALASMTGHGASGQAPEAFFLTLGVFLVEINAVVVYFVWGIEGERDRGSLQRSTGACLLTSVLIFVATAMLAS